MITFNMPYTRDNLQVFITHLCADVISYNKNPTNVTGIVKRGISDLLAYYLCNGEIEDFKIKYVSFDSETHLRISVSVMDSIFTYSETIEGVYRIGVTTETELYMQVAKALYSGLSKSVNGAYINTDILKTPFA